MFVLLEDQGSFEIKRKKYKKVDMKIVFGRNTEASSKILVTIFKNVLVPRTGLKKTYLPTVDANSF